MFAFKDQNIGIAVGNLGTIIRTTNGGESWTEEISSTTNDLYGITFIDQNTWAAVGINTILRTTDGGITWSYQPSPGASNAYMNVSFSDINNGLVVSENGKTVRTTDGGMTWTSQFIGQTSLYGVSFVSQNSALVVGGYGIISKTIDGGITWNKQSDGTLNDLDDICFTDSNHGTVVGGNGTILRTFNGGINWEIQQVAYPTLTGVHYIDSNFGDNCREQ